MRLLREEQQRLNLQAHELLQELCAVGQLLYSNCSYPCYYHSVILPEVCWGVSGQMLVTLVMQVLPLACLMEMCQVQIKQ